MSKQVSTASRDYPIPKAQTKKIYEQEKQNHSSRCDACRSRITDIRARQRLAGINEATSMVTSYFDPGTKLIYAIGAVVGLIGGIKVYGKFSSGDPDTSKTAASWFGACIFLIVSATILRSFFL